MALTSVNPQQPAPIPTASEDPDVGNGVKLPQTPIPGSNPLDTQAMSTLKGDAQLAQSMNNVAASAGKSSNSSGGIFGAIGSVIGKAIPFLFGEGGMVDSTGVAAKGLAEGGLNSGGSYGTDKTIEPKGKGQSTDPSAPGMEHAYGLGYAVGAPHQRDFDGTPETLEQATQMIAQLMKNSPSGAVNFQEPLMNDQSQGGEFSTLRQGQEYYQHQDPKGLGTTRFAGGGMPMQQSAGQMMPQQPRPMPQAPAGQMQAQVMPQPRPMQMPQQPQPMPQGPAMQHPVARGFMQNNMPAGQMPTQGLATGGPPLQPGQPFMGEGEVKGPGGPTEDLIPAKLSNGEYVMSSAATAFFGVDKMDKMNEQGKQGFMQSKMQVEANQAPPGMPGQPPGAAAAMPSAPPGNGMMQPPQLPMQQAKGGPAVQRTRGSGYMG